MLYRDLVQFEPLESVIQLREADQYPSARRLVETYVISERMADVLVNVVIPQLQIDRPLDNKGVLVVGNYGTGKSHLMSVVSAVAEHGDLAGELTQADVRAAAASFAGRFKVVRVEVTSKRSLRDSLLEEVEMALEAWGTPYPFPAADQVTHNKDILIAAVGEFQKKYPNQGILLVVDELLDFLRSREERELILDLSFLRELGEVAALTPFRFIGGLQEALFDSPRFAHMAEQLRRVRDRFEQVRILRQDIAYVVTRRLLRKSDTQLAWISDHLRQFAPLYPHMAERLPEFTQLFPIHPAYLSTFERVLVVEQRQVLKTISQAMRRLMEMPVPANEPGLVSYDHYWDVLRDDPSMRTLPGVLEVVEKSSVLDGRIQAAYTRRHLLPLADRIIKALSVHRLTTDDIYVPLGATPEELRDDLCLFVPMPQQTADFLLDQVRVALQEIMRTVSGQYISYNDANGQYYLDVKKDIDFDAKIAERGRLMGSDELNRYFFDGLRQVLKPDSTTYITGHRIWEHELPWLEKKVTRPGYLFFGAPDARTTAQPPRDFYVYVLPPFGGQTWTGAAETDEVLFRLTGLDAQFEELVRLYAGARALAGESAAHRDVYEGKATGRAGYFPRLLTWLNNDLVNHLEVTHDGVARPARQVLAEMRSSASRSVEDLMAIVAAHYLTAVWRNRYPDYPAFSRLAQPVTGKARAGTAMEAVRFLAGRGRTNLAVDVLEGLRLINGEGQVRPGDSPYARGFLEKLMSKPEGQVVNRDEVMEVVGSSAAGVVEKDRLFWLEPEWVAVVLLALAQNGDIVLNLGGQVKLDASSVEQAATKAIEDLADFRFYARPRMLPLALWRQLFEALELPPGLLHDEAQSKREEAVRKLQERVQAELQRTAMVQGRVQQGVQLWNRSVFTDRPLVIDQQGTVSATAVEGVSFPFNDLNPYLRHYKKFLEMLSRFDRPGKLRNLSLAPMEIKDAQAGRAWLDRAATLLQLVDRLQPLTTYLVEAQHNLPGDHPWSERAALARDWLLDEVRRLGRGDSGQSERGLAQALETLKADYISEYARLHRQMVLGLDGDEQRKRLYQDARYLTLKELAKVDLLNEEELRNWERDVSGLRTDPGFHEGALRDSPTYNGFRPAAYRHLDFDARAQLNLRDGQLDDMLLRWRQALHAGLNSDVAQASRANMGEAEKGPVEAFLQQPATGEAGLPAGFVDAANEALRGIHALQLSLEEMALALKQGGLPCTAAELEARFGRFIRDEMRRRGLAESKTRLTLAEPQ